MTEPQRKAMREKIEKAAYKSHDLGSKDSVGIDFCEELVESEASRAVSEERERILIGILGMKKGIAHPRASYQPADLNKEYDQAVDEIISLISQDHEE